MSCRGSQTSSISMCVACVLAVALLAPLGAHADAGTGFRSGRRLAQRFEPKPGGKPFKDGGGPKDKRPAGRTFYIAADSVPWSYAPKGDACTDPALAALQQPVHNFADPTGGTFMKALYREYVDGTFKVLKPRPARQEHLGLLGPLIYAEAGSVINIVFKNNLPEPVNMEPTGGHTWTDQPPGFLAPVQPGETATYKWMVPEQAAPQTSGKGAQNSRLYMYRSSVRQTAHDNAGLVGPIIVTAKGQANADGSTQGVDRDIVTLYHVIEEEASAFQGANANLPSNIARVKMSINGYTYCNLPGLGTVQGERVRWHVASVGSELAVHNFHWHGNTFLHNGNRMDGINILGSNTASLDMSNDAPGNWLFHCHVNSHLDNGMLTTYTVKPARGFPVEQLVTSVYKPLKGVTRTYYVQAEEVLWNYAPQDGLMCSGTKEPFDETASVFLGPPDDAAKRIGSIYTKALYVQYTDDTFTQRVPRAAKDEYLGLLGPVIRANVGDTIKVVFRNNLKYYVSLHPHGVLYGKDAEGAPYNDLTTGKLHDDDMVKPNATFTYFWQVPERAGPGPADPSSIVWLYHSHVDESADTNAGLLGAIVINRAGPNRRRGPFGDWKGGEDDLLPSDIDDDAIFFFTVMDEFTSRYATDNVKRALGSALSSTPEALAALYSDPDFLESSKKHSINGYMYCNGPRPKFTAFKRTRMHIIALGSVLDIHSPSIEGGSFMTFGSHASSMVQLPGGMTSTDVVFTEKGLSTMACRVGDHYNAGMIGLYEVAPALMPKAITGGATRKFFMAAEKVEWDYAPQGYKQCTNEDMSASAQPLLTASPTTIGAKRAKALFVQYTDASMATKADRPAHFGLMGPVMGAEVGDVLEVTLKNNLDFPVSFAPDSGLISMHDAALGKEVAPGASFTYRYIVPAQAGPLPGDLSTVAFHYASDVDLPAHTTAGLFGLLLISAPGVLMADGITPKDADVLLPLHLQVFNENASPLYPEQLQAIEPSNRASMPPESNIFASINGFSYCNLPPPTVKLGQKLRVVFSVFGSEESLITPRILGQTLVAARNPLASAQLIAAITAVADVDAIMPGTWPIVDDIHGHLDGGMIAQVVVETPPPYGRRLL